MHTNLGRCLQTFPSRVCSINLGLNWAKSCIRRKPEGTRKSPAFSPSNFWEGNYLKRDRCPGRFHLERRWDSPSLRIQSVIGGQAHQSWSHLLCWVTREVKPCRCPPPALWLMPGVGDSHHLGQGQCLSNGSARHPVQGNWDYWRDMVAFSHLILTPWYSFLKSFSLQSLFPKKVGEKM